MSVGSSPGQEQMQGRPGKTNAGTGWTSSCQSREKDSSLSLSLSLSRVRNGYGRCGYIIIGSVWHASLQVQREGWVG